MNRLFENKFAFAAIALVFALALGWNATQGTGLLFPGHATWTSGLVILAHGPSLPPDPWVGGGAGAGTDSRSLIAHGPSLPPDPWVGGGAGAGTDSRSLMAHGPSLPPDPWVGGGAGAGTDRKSVV